MSWEIREGDCLEVLRGLDASSVQTCVTSPPYWGLRDYGTATWEGGDPDCDHRQETPVQADSTSTLGVPADGGPRRIGDENATVVGKGVYKDACGKCGAKRIDSQLGLEPTPEQYVANLVQVFREVRRVLRDDGTLWLNLGDSYAGGGTAGSEAAFRGKQGTNRGSVGMVGQPLKHGLKPKDLVGIPWRVAFALQADGWWLRSDIIWSKPNPMPESVTDRPTRAHEYIFLLTKSARYFYDSDAIREENSEWSKEALKGNWERRTSTGAPDRGGDTNLSNGSDYAKFVNPAGRNKRSVWDIATQPYPEAHFATFPPKLVEPCILAGSPPKCCGECGAPWERIIERQSDVRRERGTNPSHHAAIGQPQRGEILTETRTLGWRSTCEHDDDDSGQSTVLDPFCGAGTTGLVATQHGRDFIGIELNPEYAEMARERIRRYEANPAGALEGDPEPIEGQIGLL